MDTNQERYERGMTALRQIMGDQAQLIYDLAETAPDLARFTVEAFGDIYANPALDVKTREIATVAALTALGHAPKQLRAHIHGALTVGVSRQAIIEVITQMYAYAGFPAALNGMAIAHEVFAERDQKEQHENQEDGPYGPESE